jgi:hypothetical protein
LFDTPRYIEFRRKADINAATRKSAKKTEQDPWEKAFRITAKNFPKKFKAKADLDNAVAAMRQMLAQRGISEAALRGPAKSAKDLGDFSNQVTEYIGHIVNGSQGTRSTKLSDGSSISVLNTPNADAYAEALNYLDRWGIFPAKKKTAFQQKAEGLAGTDEYLMPVAMADAIANDIQGYLPTGLTFGSASTFERLWKEFGPELNLNTLLSLPKQGMTIGYLLPHWAFMTSQFIANLAQVAMFQGVTGVARQASFIGSHPAFVKDVVGSMLADSMPNFQSTRAIMTATGAIYTADDVAALAKRYGLSGSYPASEFIRALDQDVREYTSTYRRTMAKMPIVGKAWQRGLRDCASAIDNTFRIGIFTDALKRGLSPAEAAVEAQRIVLDYTRLSDFERKRIAPFTLFYSYTRRNAASMWWLMKRNPGRFFMALRVVNGTNKFWMGEEAPVLSNDYTSGRMTLWMTPSGKPSVKGIRFLAPATNPIDFVNLLALVYGAQWPFGEEWTRNVLGRLHPGFQASFGLATAKSVFGGGDLDDPGQNVVPASVMALDNWLFFGALRNMFDIRLAEVESPIGTSAIDPARGYQEAYVAYNWRPWFIMTQGLGFRRTLMEQDRLDRTNIGMEMFLTGGQPSPDGLPPELAAPRMDYGQAGEVLGFLGIRPVRTPDIYEAERSTKKAINVGLEEEAKRLGKKVRQ